MIPASYETGILEEKIINLLFLIQKITIFGIIIYKKLCEHMRLYSFNMQIIEEIWNLMKQKGY